jgi:CarboxypepD_reg-like domain
MRIIYFTIPIYLTIFIWPKFLHPSNYCVTFKLLPMRICSTKGMMLPFKKNHSELHQILKIILACSIFLFFFVSLALSQSKKITGRVTDLNTGEALPGVTVTIERTPVATITDSSGRYALEVPSSRATLLFSYVGVCCSGNESRRQACH